MSRALIRLTLSPSAPPLLVARHDARVLAPFGRWLREQVETRRRRWTAVTIERVRLTQHEVVLLLEFRAPVPPLVAALAVVMVLRRETTAAAIGVGWLPEDVRLWGDQQIVAVVAPALRNAPVPATRWPAGRTARPSTTPRGSGR